MSDGEPETWTPAVQAALRLHRVPGIGPRTYGDLIDHFGSAAEVLKASPAELAAIPGIRSKLLSALSQANAIDIDPILQSCRQHKIRILDRDHDQYPELLREIYDPPSILFVQGQLQPTDRFSVAIVGTRHCSSYGQRVAQNLARGLSLAGITIVSGLARGIDAAAHRGAIAGGGRTIAVLGGGLLKLYPPEHQSLAEEVIANGALISEALPEQAAKSGAFPRRNRIVTGLSLGVIVVEAGDRSGALISARLATEQNREVFAVPGQIDQPLARGCHSLIRDGAMLVESVEDVLEQLGAVIESLPTDHPNQRPDGQADGDQEQASIRQAAEQKLDASQTAVLNAIHQSPTEFDEIIVSTELSASQVLSAISVLEIRRLIRRLSSTSFVRI